MMENFVKGCTFLFLFSFFQATKEDCFKDWLSLRIRENSYIIHKIITAGAAKQSGSIGPLCSKRAWENYCHGAAAQHQSQPSLVEFDRGLLAVGEWHHVTHHCLQYSHGSGAHWKLLPGVCHHTAQRDAQRDQHLHCQSVLLRHSHVHYMPAGHYYLHTDGPLDLRRDPLQAHTFHPVYISHCLHLLPRSDRHGALPAYRPPDRMETHGSPLLPGCGYHLDCGLHNLSAFAFLQRTHFAFSELQHSTPNK